MINVNINGQIVEVENGATILEAAKIAGTNIPSLCHHPKLHPYGACRLCLVEVQGARTLVPSCTAPATDNMVVLTDTPRVKQARKFILSMLFSERNHFCMYCQATDGDCELQNAAYAEDMTNWPITPPYLPFAIDASHPDFILENNRCILCRRCVRVCGELVGNFTLGFEERGSTSLLIADNSIPLGESTCISCGNCVQFCPTGALFDRRSAYQGRQTDLTHTESICLDCALGCGRLVLTRNNRLVRLEGLLEAEVNQGLLCGLGRYTPVKDQRQRVTTPMIRREGQLVPANWEEALDVVAMQMKTIGSDKISAYISPRQSIEALNAFVEFFRDHLQVRQIGLLNQDETASVSVRLAQEFGVFESDVTVLSNCDAALVLGADLTDKHQVAGFMLKRQLPGGLKLFSDPDATKPEMLEEFKNRVNEWQTPVMVLGEKFVKYSNLATLRELINWADGSHVRLVLLKGEANAYAAAINGVLPSDPSIRTKLAYMIVGDQHANPNIVASLQQSDFKVVQAAYQSELTDIADVVLPAMTWLEEEGHYLSTDGKLNINLQALQPIEHAKSTVESLTTLATKFGLTLTRNWMSALTDQPTSITLSL